MLLPAYTGNPSIAVRFWDLVAAGVPLAKAPALLFDLYVTRHFYVIAEPSAIEAIRLDDGGNLTVELSDGSKPDPETILTRDPGGSDKPPQPLAVLYQIRDLQLERERANALFARAKYGDDEDSPRLKRLEAARARYEAEEKAEAEAEAEAAQSVEAEPEPAEPPQSLPDHSVIKTEPGRRGRPTEHPWEEAGCLR